MTTSRREHILQALMATLNGLATVAPRIYRSRQEAFSRGSAPAVVLEPVGNEPEPKRAGVTTMPNALEVRLLLLVGCAKSNKITERAIEGEIMVERPE